MVLVLASTPKSINAPTKSTASSSSSASSSPTIHKSISAIVLSPSASSSSRPQSLSYLHKKRHSDSSILTTLPTSNDENVTAIPLIRKKSGELVKSSLKLNTLANQSRSVPTTPTYKNVHFGSAVDVRYFDEKDKPTAVSANTSPVLRSMSKRWSKRGGTGATFEFGDPHDRTIDEYLSKNRSKMFSDFDDDDDDDDDDDYDEDDDIDDESDNEVEVIWNHQALNFQKIKYNEKFNQKEKIFLERITLDDDHEKAIIGYIAVKNLSYHKEIHVRYTFDDWKTVIEIEAKFTSECTKILKRANYDRFTFKIPLAHFKILKQTEAKIQFCIRYRYDTVEIWDNNDAKNYQISVSRTVRSRLNKKSKFSLNDDYFSTNHHSNFGHQGSNFTDSNLGGGITANYTSTSQFTKDLDSYFNNYEGFKSPETPRALKFSSDDDSLSIADFHENGARSPSFSDLQSINDLHKLHTVYTSGFDSSADSTHKPIISPSDREISKVVTEVAETVDGYNKMTLLSNDSNPNLMDVRKGIDITAPIPRSATGHPLLRQSIDDHENITNNSSGNNTERLKLTRNGNAFSQMSDVNSQNSSKKASSSGGKLSKGTEHGDGNEHNLFSSVDSFSMNNAKNSSIINPSAKSKNSFNSAAHSKSSDSTAVTSTTQVTSKNNENKKPQNQPGQSGKGKGSNKSNKKPSMNSQYYQDLINSCCFFKGDEPTTISTFLDGTGR